MRTIQSRKHAADHAPRHRSTLALAAAAFALPGAVLAQAAAPAAAASQPRGETTLPTVKVQAAAPENDYKADVVSSPKFTQAIVDTPQTITVIKKELLQQEQATTLTEALRNTPGVTLQLGENGSTQTGDSIYLRGFDSSQSIFVDGIRDLGAVSRDMFNIDQVEVVKGPSGSDIGRGASSAYINLVSKSAQPEAAYSGTLIGGTADRKRVTADLNTPLSPTSAVRLNVMAQDYGVPGRDEVRSKRWGVAPTATFGLGTGTRATVSYLHVHQDNVPDGGVSTFGLKGYAYGTGATALIPGPPVDSSNFYGLSSDYDHVDMDMFTSRLETDLAPGQILRNTTRIGNTKENVVVTGVNAVVTPTSGAANDTTTRSRQGRIQANEILTNQTNLTSKFRTFGLKNSLSSGIELTWERQKTQTPTSTSGATAATGAANLYAPNPDDNVAMPVYHGAYTLGTTLTASAYTFETLDIRDDFLISGGLRFDKFHTDTNAATYTAASGATPASLNQAAPIGLTGQLWSYKIGAVYKPARNGSVYLTYSDSKQPPGGTNLALSAQPNSQSQAGLKPLEGTNLELGTKWDLFGGDLLATAAIYRSTDKNELISDGAPVPTYAQVGERRVSGVELGLVGNITKELAASVGYAYMDSKIVRGAPTQQGGVIVFSPKNTFSSWVTYKLPAGFTLGGGMNFADNSARSSAIAAPTTNLLTAPSYWVGNAMVSYDVTKNAQLQLNVYNLFDRKYIQTLNNGGSRYTPGAERNALASLNVKF